MVDSAEATIFPVMAAGAHQEANELRLDWMDGLASRGALASYGWHCRDLGVGEEEPAVQAMWLLLLRSVRGIRGGVLVVGEQGGRSLPLVAFLAAREAEGGSPARSVHEQGSSQEEKDGGEFALLLIDGSRDAEIVARDLAFYPELVVEGGFLVTSGSSFHYAFAPDRPRGNAAVSDAVNAWILGLGAGAGWVELGPVGQRRIFWKVPRTTMVTMLYDIGRDLWEHFQRPMSYYLEQAKRSLSFLNPMVIHTEPKYASLLRGIRESYGLGSWTEIRCVPYEQTALGYRQLATLRARWRDPEYADVSANSTAMLPPEYILVNWLKTEFLHLAIDRDPFCASSFCWIDLGLHAHMLRDEHLFRSYSWKGAPPDGARFCQVGPIRTDIRGFEACARVSHQNLAASCFLVSRAYRPILDRWFAFFEDAVAAGWPTTEERLVELMSLDHPEWFQLYPDTRGWQNVFEGLFDAEERIRRET